MRYADLFARVVEGNGEPMNVREQWMDYEEFLRTGMTLQPEQSVRVFYPEGIGRPFSLEYRKVKKVTPTQVMLDNSERFLLATGAKVVAKSKFERGLHEVRIARVLAQIPLPLDEDAASPVSDEFLSALRQWGDNTVIDRGRKEQVLRQFAAEANRFVGQNKHEWFLRGQCVTRGDLTALRRGKRISINLLGGLSSWTRDVDTAYSFADNADCEVTLVIMKGGLKPFFDFTMLGRALQGAGLLPKEDEYDLHDPIREAEVIVDHPPEMTIERDDVLEFCYFDANGKQKGGAFS